MITECPVSLEVTQSEERDKFTIPSPTDHKSALHQSMEDDLPAPKLRSLRNKFNSTASVFMSNSIKAADSGEIILCLSKVLAGLIKKDESVIQKTFIEIFSENSFPLGDGKTDLLNSPSFETIEEFLIEIFQAQDLSPECGVMSVVYIERLVNLTGITLHASNWRRILLGALLLSAKVWEDLAVWNVDFLSLFPNLSLSDLNRLEREYLISLNYTVALTASVYARYYFQLRSFSDITEEFFPLKPLNASMASKLERRSVGLEETEKILHIHSTKSYSLNPYVSTTSLSIEQIQSKYANKNFD